MKKSKRLYIGMIIVVILAAIGLSGCSLFAVDAEFTVTPSAEFSTEYVVGENIPTDKIKVVYDGKTLAASDFELVEKSSVDIAEPNELLYAEKVYAVKYDGKTSDETLTVKFYKPLTKVELVRAAGDDAEYYAGDEFDIDDWRVKAWYSEENSVTLPLKANMLENFDTTDLTAGTHSLKLSLLNVTNDAAWVLTVMKRSQTKPELTAGVTDTTATARRTDGAEYRLGEEGEWVSEHTFSGLTPNTEYTIYARMPETATHAASEIASFSFTTLKSVRRNVTAEVYDITHNGFKVRYAEDLEVSAGTLQFTRGDNCYIFVNASPNKEYILEYWLKSNDTYYETEKSSVTVRTKAIPAEFSIKNDTFIYNGSPREILYGLKLKDGGDVSVPSQNFAVKYTQNGVEVVPKHAGSYDVTIKYKGNDYAVEDYVGTLTIGKKPLSVTADGVSITYGDAAVALTYKTEGLVEGDSLMARLSERWETTRANTLLKRERSLTTITK